MSFLVFVGILLILAGQWAVWIQLSERIGKIDLDLEAHAMDNHRHR